MLAAQRDVPRPGKKKLSALDAELETLRREDSPLSAQDRAWRTARAKEERQRAERELAMLDAAGVEHLHAGEIDARVMKCDGRNVFAIVPLCWL